MADLFLKIVNMSISASWMVLVVLVLRFCFKKIPKWIRCILWGIVGLRLVMPFSIESMFSLIPSEETISKVPDAPRPHFESGINMVDNSINEYINATYFEGVSKPVGYFTDVTTLMGSIWSRRRSFSQRPLTIRAPACDVPGQWSLSQGRAWLRPVLPRPDRKSVV